MAEEKKNDFTVDMGEKQSNGVFEAANKPAPVSQSSATGGAEMMSILAYCGSSILMTTTNKYVLTGTFNLNFFLLCIQVSIEPD